MNINWTLKTDENHIAWLTFDRKESKVNSLSDAVLKEFDQILNLVAQNKQMKALIIRSGKQNGFIVGADINQFENFQTAEEAIQFIQFGQTVFNKLENLTIPTIALIEGYCLGGGLELALACRYRIG